MSKFCTFVEWEDVPHLPKETKEAILASIPPWQRDSRTKGVPQLGAGAIYQVPTSDIEVTGFEIPKHWPRCFGMDVGWNRTAALWGAYDREASTLYVYDEYYRGQAEPSIHAAAILNRGKWIPGVIDPAARGRMQSDGTQLLSLYQGLGLDIEIADNAREAGIYRVWEMLSQGRLKIFKGCASTFAEYRLYRRDDKGQVVKKNDHLMDSLRYLVMSGIERAKVEPTYNGKQWFHWSPPDFWAG
jgi:hypothetical protein